MGIGHTTNCECCRPQMTEYTSTAITHKWTLKEIQDHIIELGKQLVTVRWYDRGDVRRRMKHWVEKLERYKEAKEESSQL